VRKEQLYELIDLALSQDGHSALDGVRHLRANLEWIERRAVQRARDEGMNWAEVGRLLGMSRQSASERFRALLATPPFRALPEPASDPNDGLARLIREYRGKPKDDPDPVAW
jgi:hypothetical protein